MSRFTALKAMSGRKVKQVFSILFTDAQPVPKAFPFSHECLSKSPRIPKDADPEGVTNLARWEYTTSLAVHSLCQCYRSDNPDTKLYKSS